ncbi:MAG: SH3 domain-containing protein [Chloroflexi bacterium]|nr:SH3 domain-containing protein [Chloroflexota bacterium]
MHILIVFALMLLVFAPIAAAREAAQQRQLATPLLIVNTPVLNVRSGPGVQFTVVTVVSGGTELPVLGTNLENSWYLVNTIFGAGWIDFDFSVPRGDFRNVPLVEIDDLLSAAAVAPQPPAISIPPTGQVTTSGVERFRAFITVQSVNLRVAAAQEADPITLLFRDDSRDYAIVDRTADANNVQWVAINVPGAGIGWVEADKTQTRLAGTFRTVVEIVGDVVQVTQSPGVGGTGLPVLLRGDEAFLLNLTDGNQFAQVELADGTIGWIPFDSAQIRTGTTTDNAVAGAQPAAGQQFAASPLNPANPAAVTAQGGVALPVPQVAVTIPELIVNTSFLNVRSGPGSQYTVISTLPGGVYLPPIGVTGDNVWWLVQGTFGQGWVADEFVIFRGNRNNVPIIANAY